MSKAYKSDAEKAKKSNQIKSNLSANTKYERKKTDEKPEVNQQNEKNNNKLEC